MSDTGEPLELENIMIGLEMGLLDQEQVVSRFRELAEHDITEAAARYGEFAERLDQAAAGGNAQIRSMIGGPDSLSRAGLVDIMAQGYSMASDEVKIMIRDESMRPLLRDNYFYVRMAVAMMTNPQLVGDIIREEPLANPGANYYEDSLLKSNSLQDPDLLQIWLDRFGGNLFAAMAIALQRDHDDVVVNVLARNLDLFRGAAHVTAANQDVSAEIKVMRGSTLSVAELTAKSRSRFVDAFSEMVREEAEQANWLPLSELVRFRFGS